jgi:hypothetical protein
MLVSFLLSNPSTASQSGPTTKWFNTALPIAERFFALSETLDTSANGRVILALLASLNDLRVTLAELPHPDSLCKPRSHLLNAMEATLYAMTESLIRNNETADRHRRAAIRSLTAFRRRLAYLGVE